ncbi:MAG: putative nicotinamide N-methyase [Gammaproteobacteria bacterium]|jgi:predicted nicotinamide N-methyase
MSSIRVRYETIEFGQTDIHIRSLRDKQEFHDPFGEAEYCGISSSQWSLFGVVWDSSRILADEMVLYDIAGKRILEMGCGIGLASLLLNSRDADITATDYHPEVGRFLIENVRLNGGRDIPFLQTDWVNERDNLGLFDVLIGSDIIYEVEHANFLSRFIDRHSRPNCEVIIVDPGRRHYAKFSQMMLALGYSCEQSKPLNSAPEIISSKCKILRYSKSRMQ